MKTTIVKIMLAASFLALAACNKPYDPIGPNRPSPVLLVNPLELAFSSDGGTLSSKISTNAETVQIGELPEWIESAKVSDDLSSIEVKVKPNADEKNVKRGTVKMVCASGDNTVTQSLKIFQAGTGSEIAFASFTGKTLPSGWKADDPTRIAVGNGYLAITSDDIPGYLYTCPDKFSSRTYYFSVDMKMKDGGDGGVKLYLNDDPKQDLKIYLSYNSARNRGGIWVQNGSTWCAMDDGTVGSGDCPNKWEEVYVMPDASEMDDWWRLEVYNTETTPNEPVIAVKALKTLNGETKVLKALYSRKFTFVNADPGCAGLWGRSGETQFKNFVLSYGK